ncbi:hypothetical protein [Prescottella equi]|uniref:hypothetical protein n=1 Tax=Rhodococcus hoagii TaxID=43767 RepID=UPI000A9B7D9B|nr:hypothetical protein [Prescottella equi]
MTIQGMWLAVDIIGTRLGGDVFIHSAAEARVAKTLRRCANALGLDKRGEAVVRAVIEAALDGREIPSVEGLFVETRQVDASDGTPVGLIVWIGAQPPTSRPVYNGWVLDMQAMTTRTSGDNPTVYGDFRETDEERHVMHLFTYLNPEDVWSLVGGYYDALTGDHGDRIESYWSLQPGGQWVHFWSSCHLHLADRGDTRILHGLTLQLKDRKFESNIASLIRYSNATLLLVEASHKIPLTTVGRHAPLGEDRVAQVLSQIDLAALANPEVPRDAEQRLEIDGVPFVASTFALHSSREKHGDPVAIVLLVEDDAAAPETVAS